MNPTSLLHYVDQFETTTLVVPALLLLFIGNKVVEEHPGPRAFANRAAALLFLGVLAGQLHLHWPLPAEMLTEIVFRSLLLAGLALGSAWIVAPAIAGLYRYTIAVPCKTISSMLLAVLHALIRILTHPGRSLRERYERRRKAVEQRRQQSEGEVLAKKYSADQKRRDDARAVCELLFHRHGHALNNRFTKEAYMDFVHKYMGDGRPPEEAEERGHQLQEIILQHAQEIQPPQKPYTIESLADWYKTTKQLIDGLPVDARYKQAQMAQLNARYTELMQSLLENLRP